MTLLRLAIRGAGLTQVGLAQAVGLTEKHMSQLVTGKAFMSMDCAARIGRALGVNPTALLVAHSVERDAAEEIARVRAEQNTWELVAKLDPATAQRVADRMREIVFGNR